MTRRLHRKFALPCALACALAIPAAAHAQAQNGGAPSPGSAPAQPLAVADGQVAVTAPPAGTMVGRTVHFRGAVGRGDAGRTIQIERLDVATGWTAIAQAVAAADGRFLARWKSDHIGRYRMRATVQRPGAAQVASASPELAVTIHRPAMATWYGPGFYGRKTACGVKLTRATVGLAHKTLPCGTQVAVMYKGKSAIVPVIDRGPFRAGTDWDLTNGAAKALGFTFTDTIGAVRLRDVPLLATPMQAPPLRRR